jgi:hypothetical protein
MPNLEENPDRFWGALSAMQTEPSFCISRRCGVREPLGPYLQNLQNLQKAT